MRYFIIIILLFFFSHGIAQKKEIITKSTIKLENKNTNIRDLIETDGYYYMTEYPDSNCCMFFEDGTWVHFSFKKGLSENEITANMSKSVVSWIENKQLYWGSYWGVYKIEGDTLIAYWYDKGSFWKGWSLREIWYKVINRKTIQAVYSKSLLKRDETYYRDMNVSPWISSCNMHFSSADSLPSSDCWLKEEKWIWRNESDWKEYMKSIERKKKEKK